jgi:hypothetical protein
MPHPPPLPGSEAAAAEASAASLDAYLLSPKFHGRVRAATVALLGLTAAACATADWEAFYGGGGRRTVFSDVRPALRSAFNRLYGVEAAAPAAGGGGEGGAPAAGQQQQQQQPPAAAARR